MVAMLVELAVVFMLSLALIRVVRANAPRLGLLDVPNERSSHKKRTPRAAGIGFFLAVVLVFPFFHWDILLAYPWTFVAIFIIFIVGVLDDHHDTSTNTKFIVIILATVFLYFDGIYIHRLGTFFGFPLVLGWFALPFTVFAVVGFTNALNLIDGLDGLAATVSIVILGAFLWVGYVYDDSFMTVLSGVFIATLLAFLVYNWHPASIFMGDSG
ncbi:MAG: glycosyltransferase family 4 protein [Sulfurovum sp.]